MNPITVALILSGVILVGTILSVEIGYRWGLRDTRINAALSHEGVTSVEASAYALLGLLLAFSYAGATTRLENKRQLIVDEANAIGTAYLRVDVLPAEAQPPIREEFKRLIDARIAAHTHRVDTAQSDRELAILAEAQARIWSMAVAASSGSSTASLLVLPPLNTMIDVATSRRVAMQYHLPRLILGLLIGASILSGLLAGYAMSKRMRRSWLHVFAYALLLALTIYTVLDLDQARAGLINIDVSYQPLYELRQAIK
jgi:hypothetical protein